MARFFSVACLGILLLPGVSSAQLNISNVRPCYGYPLGATRHETKLIPGDILFISFDIDGLKFDEKTGRANYLMKFELLDSKEKVFFQEEKAHNPLPGVGGTRMPAEA